jgi:hypothetical protein
VEKSVANPDFQRESAETLALQAVSWLATDADLLGAFLNDTGASLSSLVADLKQPAFLAAVLDFVLADDSRVLALAEKVGVPPTDIALRRAALPGGDLPNWT